MDKYQIALLVSLAINFIFLFLWLYAIDKYMYYKALWQGRPEMWESGDH